MMKRKNWLVLGLTVCLLLSSVLGVFASDREVDVVYNDDGSCVVYNEDGSYLVVSAVESEEIPSARSSERIRFGIKDATLYNEDNEVLWVYTLRGYFSFIEGVSATCTNALDDPDILDNHWSVKESETLCSGNQAIANATFVEKILLITVRTVPVSLTITCDEYGNLS